MMTIKTISDFLEQIAPTHLQESYDNAGLLTGNYDWEVTAALVALDTIPEIIDEAIERNCNLIIAHHPIIFKGLKQINGKNYVERAIIKAIKNDIAIYAIHTNLDNVHRYGVNERIALKLELQELKILAPKADDDTIGSGMIGRLNQPMDIQKFLALVKSKMKVSCIRHTRLIKEKVQRIAVCGGSGSFLIQKAIDAGADVFISADIKYHEFFDADGKIIIADIGHYESEQFTIDLLVELLNSKFSNFAAHFTNLNTNPIKYF